MTLAKWLKKSACPAEELAAILGVRRQTVHRYLAGTRFPRPKMVEEITRITGGEVTASDWYAGNRLRSDDAPRACAPAA